MKFQLVVFRVCLIFYIWLRTSKSIRDSLWKKVLLATALFSVQDAQRRLLFKQTGSLVAPKETIAIVSSFLELGRRKLSMQPKFVAAQKMLLKNRNPAKHS